MTNSTSNFRSSGTAPLESSGKIPLDYVNQQRQRNTKTALANFFTCKAALRWYIITLLIINMFIGAMILGSLQQLYRSISVLTEGVATATMSGVLQQNSAVETPVPQPKKK